MVISMEIEILEKRENPLAERVEVRFRVSHPRAATPPRLEVKERLASLLQVNPSLIVIEKMVSLHGKAETMGIARSYQDEGKMKSLEPEYLLKRMAPKEGQQAEPEAEKKPVEQKP